MLTFEMTLITVIFIKYPSGQAVEIHKNLSVQQLPKLAYEVPTCTAMILQTEERVKPPIVADV